jgi:HAMP domain-containing protein
MGLRAKFNLAMLAAFAVGLALAAAIAWNITRENARAEVSHEAALIITEATAARNYTDTEVGPLLQDQTKIRFLPQTIPFFAAQTSFREVQKQFPDYAYKEAALNPTNPADHATDWEADIINTFRNDPSLKEFSTVRNTVTGPVLVVARPVTVEDKSCLICHSVPSAAPPSMIDLYGSNNGFGWKLGTTIAAQLVSVPMSVPLERATRIFTLFLTGLVIVFAVVLLLLNLLLNYVIIRPMRRISATATEVSLGNMDAPEIEPKGRDEVSELAQAFNRMRRSLANAMRMLSD